MTRSLLALGLAAAIVGCAQQSPTVTATSPLPAALNKPRVLEFQLVPQTGVAARGSVRVDVTETGYRVTLTASGLAPDSSSVVNIHAGSCALVSNDVEQLVGRMAADGSGKGTISQFYAGAYLVSAAGRIITLHGPAKSEYDLVHIACVDMTN